MIEARIFNWVNISDSMQLIDAYNRKNMALYYKFFYLLRKGYECNSRFGVYFFTIISFAQFISIAVFNGNNDSNDSNDKSDLMVLLITSLSKVLLLQEMIESKGFYFIIIIVFAILFIGVVGIVVYVIGIIITIDKQEYYNEENKCNWLIILLTIINKILLTILIGPLINISLFSILCNNNNNSHIFLQVTCYQHWLHIIFLSISIVNILFFTCYTLLLSIYSNHISIIETTNQHKMIFIRINCNYEAYFLLAKISTFLLMFLMKHYPIFNSSYSFMISYHCLLLAISIIFLIYIECTVLFYDRSMQLCHMIGWNMISWFNLVMLLKIILRIKDITLISICGWTIVIILTILYEKHTFEDSLLQCNYFDAKSLKTLEFYIRNLMSNSMTYNRRGKALIKGIVTKFENSLLMTTTEKINKYKQMSQGNAVLKMILLIYEHHLEKSLIKNEVLFAMCYFIVKYMKNYVYALSLCSKIKVSSHKHVYIKYCLTEEIKEMLTRKMIKGLNHSKDAIKHIDISSVILYNRYIDMFKIKIYDAVCNQIDYFELIKSNSTTPLTTRNIIKTGEDIIVIRNDISNLWYKIIELNPFNEENQRDYLLYLDMIIRDTEHTKIEIKRYETNQKNFLNEQNSLYHSLFDKDTTAIILIDGSSIISKVFYSTSNFPHMFGYTMKEVINMTIEDFVPNPISTFHKEISNEAVKQSTFKTIFNNPKNMIIKSKSGGIFTITAYLKPLPTVSYGLVYIGMIRKVQDRSYTIVLDKDFRICALSDVLSQGIHYTVNNNNNYGLNGRVFGCHIAIFLPEILLHMTYNNQRFSLSKEDIDLKGNLYSIDNYKGLAEKVDFVLEKIKQCGKLKKNDKDSSSNIMQEYRDLIGDIEDRIMNKPFSVFYRMKSREFLNGKYTYHQIALTNDLIIFNTNMKDKEKESMSLVNDYNSIAKSKRRSIEGAGGFYREKNQIILNICRDPSENKQLIDKQAQLPSKQCNKKLIIPHQTLNSTSTLLTPLNQFKHLILIKHPNTLKRILLFLTSLSSILSIIIINIDNISLTSSYNHMKSYLNQNKFFNSSLISTSSIYLNSINLKLLKYSYLRNDACTFIKCSEFYQLRLILSVNELKNLKTNISDFDDDYKKIINQTINITTIVRKIEVKQLIMIDGNNLLNILLSNGYRVIGNIDEYINETEPDIEINLENVIQDSFYYMSNRIIVGLNETIMRINVGNMKTGKEMFIAQIVIWLIIGITIAGIIYKVNAIERKFIKCIVYYQSGNFEEYLKQLEELKSKLGIDGEGNEDIIEGHVDGDSNVDNNNNKEKESNNVSSKHKYAKGHSNKKFNGKENSKKYNSSLQKKSKLNRIHYQKNAKINILSKYFLQANLTFAFKIFLILVIGILYFIITIFLNTSHYTQVLQREITMNSIQGVFNRIYYLFVMVKYLLLNYSNYETEKKRGIKAIHDGKPYYKIDNITFNSIEDIEKSFLKLVIPPKEDIQIPQIGDLFMQLMQYSESNSEGVKNLKVLFNGNACSVMMDKNTPQYPFCEFIWSGILKKGLDQSIVQIGVVFDSVIEDLNMLNNQETTLEEILIGASKFSELDHFANFFLHSGLIKMNIYFIEIKEESLKATTLIFDGIKIGFVSFYVVQFFLFIYVEYCHSKDLDSLINFILIVPVDYIMEDEIMHDDLIKIAKQLYFCKLNTLIVNNG